MRIITALSFVLLVGVPAECESKSPISADQPEGVSENFVTFLNELHPGNRIGYRIHEHLPLVAGAVPTSNDGAGIDPDEVEGMILEFSKAAGVHKIKRPVTEEGWIPQDWAFYFVPTEDGIDVLWVVETKDLGLPEYYSAQQCFRMSGKTNADWRKNIAQTPAFSEYDLWEAIEKESPGEKLKSLSFFRVGDSWSSFPAKRKKTISRTPTGVELETAAQLSEGEVQSILDPKHPADFIIDSDNGLMTRSNLEGDWLSGIYWEGTTHLSNHHPADCLHAIVNLGPIPPNSRKAIRGKIYWMQGNPHDLLAHWQSDFGQ